MNVRLDQMQNCVQSICEEANKLQHILKEFEKDFKGVDIPFFDRPVAEMGISDKVKVALLLLKLKDKFAEEDQEPEQES